MEIERLKDFGFDENLINKLKNLGIKKLYPYQAKIVKEGLFDKNLILFVPTAAGKTLIATLAISKILNKGKALYVVPLVALANEKYEYFKRIFPERKVALSVGDYDSADPWLANYDLIICTTEKLDSLIRHSADWLLDCKLVIIDEIHMLNDIKRGPTLEILITKLLYLLPKIKLIGLSATIKNSREIAEWLRANHFSTSFRPVELFEGVAFDSKIKFFNPSREYELSTNLSLDAAIVQDTLRKKKQILIFTSARKNAETLAKKLVSVVKPWLSKNEKEFLIKISNEIENVLEVPTKQCKELAKCVKNGIAFHHAGLLPKQRKLVEDNFRNGLIKVVVATPTLAMGVNLPAFRVVLKDIRRYYPGVGKVLIPVLEYKQFVGRAGRPGYDEWGESIIICKTEEEALQLAEKYIFGEPEEITSKLAYEPMLRMHLLALIANSFVTNSKSMKNFFKKTFFYFQYGDIYYIQEKLEEILENLKEWNFVVEKDGKIEATILGKRVSELYLDPLTAHNFIRGLELVKEKKVNEISFLQLITNSLEMKPLLNIRLTDLPEISNFILENQHCFLQEIPEEFEMSYEDFLKSVKTALLLKDWINEMSEDDILTKYNVTPGELRVRIEIADWLLYSLHELALLLKHKQVLNFLRKLRIRVQNGIKEELIPLIKLKGIGRIRARKLYNSGLKNLKDLKEISLERLAAIIGEKIALNIKKQLGENLEVKQEKQKTLTFS